MRHLSFRVAHTGSQQKTVHVCSALHRQLTSGVFFRVTCCKLKGSTLGHLTTRKLRHRLLRSAQRPLDNDFRGRELSQAKASTAEAGGESRFRGGRLSRPPASPPLGNALPEGGISVKGSCCLRGGLAGKSPRGEERRGGRSSRDPRRGAPTHTARERRCSASARRRRRGRQRQSRWWPSSGSGWPTRSTAKTSRSAATWPRPRETPPRRKHRWDRGCWPCSSSWSAVRRSSRLFRVSGWACERVGL